MPQIAQLLETYASQIFWMLLTFGLIYFGIAKAMLPKVEATIDARDKKIADDLAAAERARAEASNLEQGWDADIAEARSAAQAQAAAAKAKAAKDAADRLAKADAEIATKLASAEADLSRARSKAMASVEQVAAEAASDIVAKIAGMKISAADATKAVKTVIANA